MLEDVIYNCTHEWDNDEEWPTCTKCLASWYFLEMLEEILDAGLDKRLRLWYTGPEGG